MAMCMTVPQQHIPEFMCESCRVVKCWGVCALAPLRFLITAEVGNKEGIGAVCSCAMCITRPVSSPHEPSLYPKLTQSCLASRRDPSARARLGSDIATGILASGCLDDFTTKHTLFLVTEDVC